MSFRSIRIQAQDLRLVEANSVGQDLDGWIRAVVIGWHTELGADFICACGGAISGENSVGKVSTLLSYIEDEISSLEVSLRDRKVEDGLPS
jgi:hypothetical protein